MAMEPRRVRRVGFKCSTPHSSIMDRSAPGESMEERMHSIIYLVGLVVVVMVILSFVGLR
jgi:hypothetical protein